MKMKKIEVRERKMNRKQEMMLDFFFFLKAWQIKIEYLNSMPEHAGGKSI